ncbi:MAG: ABC transporter substrate-binding protein [Rhodoferax sp.]|jgi:NitT/TauT family transport system substrate-binding protein|nr:ABC transporter substrate-binding protein [Rhodoferax sp.]
MPTFGRPLHLRFILNTFYSGPQAWFFLADDRGYFREEGLSVTFTEGDTLANAVPRLADGLFDVGYGDLNALVECASVRPAEAPIAVYALHNRAPYTIAVPTDGPLRTPRDIQGRTLVTHPDDAAWRMFPEFCAANGIDPDTVRVEVSDLPHRALVAMMLQGNWDGVFGFVNTIHAQSLEVGIDPAQALRHFEWRNHVPSLYGGALMVTPSLLRDHPLAVQGLVRAVNRGVADTVADVEAAMDAVVRRNPVIDRNANHARLLGTLRLEMADAEGATRGIGDADPARLACTIALMQRVKHLEHPPTPAQLFDARFLPPQGERVRSLAAA